MAEPENHNTMRDANPGFEKIEADPRKISSPQVAAETGWGGCQLDDFIQSWASMYNEQGQAVIAIEEVKPATASSKTASTTGYSDVSRNHSYSDFQEGSTVPRRASSSNWDKKHQAESIQFSGMPEILHEKLLGLADEFGCSVGKMACALMKFALESHHQGILEIKPKLRNGKWTLFPQGEEFIGFTCRPAKSVSGMIQPKKRGRGGKEKDHGRLVVNYRSIPQEVQEPIRQIAYSLEVPISEVGRLLLEHTITEYEKGNIERVPGL